MDAIEIASMIRAELPAAREQDVQMYAHYMAEWLVATKNICEKGSIVFHPRTGAPIENPYIKIRDGAQARMKKMRIAPSAVWKAIHDHHSD